jgi:hypothetical protein
LFLTRYEQEIAAEGNVEAAVKDLMYFRDEIIRLQNENELSEGEMSDLMGFVNTIVTHITNGYKNEERLVEIMGGTVIETQTEKWMKQGKVQMIIELGQEDGLDNTAIIKRLQRKIGISFEKAAAYLEQYGKTGETD